MSLLDIFRRKPEHLKTGQRGEQLACRYLIKKGYTLLRRNYRSGKHEIDLIMLAPDKITVVFVEVKTRTGAQYTLPREAVTRQKQHYLSLAAKTYLRDTRRTDVPARFDVIEVYADEDHRINHIERAFNAF